MHDLTGIISGVSFHYLTGKPLVTFELNERQSALKMVDDLRQCNKLSVKIDKYREKRSLNANNYAWKLITDIGNEIRQSKDDVYLLMLKRYGQSEMFSALAHIPFGKYVKYYDEARMEEYFDPTFVAFFHDKINVTYGPGTLSEPCAGYSIEYSVLADILHPWAVPNRDT